MSDDILERAALAIQEQTFDMPGAGGLKGELRIARGMAFNIARAVLDAIGYIQPIETPFNSDTDRTGGD